MSAASIDSSTSQTPRSKGRSEVSAGLVSRLLMLYLAICLALMVAKQAERIATSYHLNPTLFTAHFSADVYRSMDDPFKPRLFSYLLAAPFVETDLEPSKPGSMGRISAPAFEGLVAGWTFGWFLATALLCLAVRRPATAMFGTAVGVSFAYSLQEMVYPYDLPALFFATLVVVLALHGRQTWLPVVLGVGVGFKETLVVFALATLFVDGTRRERLRAFGECLAVCLFVMAAIDLYSGRALFGFEALHQAQDPGDPAGPKLLANLPTLFTASSFVWCVNAGLALPLFLLPTGGELLARGFRWIGVCFVGGLFLFAGIGELRIWFELIPLCLHNMTRYLSLTSWPPTLARTDSAGLSAPNRQNAAETT
ncbi:MAG: hypothetical protein MPN21_18575 [Thermoanaerobaculia bacterium]|nr:hypothetical protein [Thermoanaerobaculia bacterium]